MLPRHSSALRGHIRYLLHSLNNTNSHTLFQDLSLFAQRGTDESILILKSCLDHMSVIGKDLTNVQPEPLYGLIFKYMLGRPNFDTVLSESFRSMEINADFLANISSALHLTLHEKVGFSLALLNSEDLDITTCGKKYCMAQIGELYHCLVSVDSAEQIHSTLTFLRRSPGLAKHVDSFIKMLSLVDLKDDERLILAPFLSNEMYSTYDLGDLSAVSGEYEFDSFFEEMEKEKSMANIIKDLGYGCTTTVSQCKEVLCLFSPLTEPVVARLLGTIARTHTGLEDNKNAYLTLFLAIGNSNFSVSPSLNSWNTDVLVDSINQLAPGINWIQVIENLDHEGFYLPDEGALSFFMAIFRRACQDPFPLHAICGSIWKNTEGQISFLKYAVSVPPEVFTFAHSERQLKYANAVDGLKSQVGHANHAWLCLDLLEVLCQLAEWGQANGVHSMLKQPLEQCPEVLLLGLAHINTAYNLLQYEVSSTVFPKMLNSRLGSGMILYLWNVNPFLLLRGFVDAYKIDPENIGRILDVCQALKILSPVLDMLPSYFGTRLAAVASQRELLDFEKWLSSKLIVHKDSFFEECLKFLKDVGAYRDIFSEFSSESGSVWNHYLDTTPMLMKVLQAHAGLIVSTKLLEELGKLLATYMHAASATSGETNASTPSADGYTDDIKEEAKSYFRKMFSGELTVDVIIQMLVRFKGSADIREQSLIKCMIGNLFEEYEFVPKYPDMQLKIAAVLFGSLIKHQIVTHLTLGSALRGVLDALRKPPETKMFVFGTMALEQFVNRLIEWPQYCNHILQIPHLRGTRPELVVFIEREIAKIHSGHSKSGVHCASADQQHSSISIQANSTNTEVPSSSSTPLTGSVSKPIETNPVRLDESQNLSANSSTGFARPSRSTTSATFGSALNIETLVAGAERRGSSLEAPSSEIQDKVSFIINNLSASNLEAKANDFAEILKDPYHPWFGQYMVMKRASIEPNFHDLYLKFLDKVSSRSLNKEIVEATYENCKVLLGSELIKSSSEERSLLKNLGSWLGKITIGRNQVLRAREIDLKSLILEAYEKGLMIAIIPFTSKILEQCQSSTAYRPPNPYTMSIIGLLTEIYSKPNLKMNLKFEIEVLFKNIGVDMKDVMPTSLLKGIVRQVEGNPDFSNKDASVSQQHLTGDVKTSTIPPINQVDIPLEVASPSHPGRNSNIPSQIPTAAPGIDQQVVVNPKLHSLGLYLHFQSAIPSAMERAIKDIAPGVVQRSISTATQTTKKLILKDYAMEADETRIRNAAHLMVASLAGSLALVTCKEPLRDSLLCQLRSSLQGLNYASELLEQAVQLVTNDNLDLGYALIEQSAKEKAIQAIDADIAQHLSLRRNQREQVGSAYFDSAIFTQGHTGFLPEALRPKPGRLSHSQQRVYEGFVELALQNQSGIENSGVSAVLQPLDLVSLNIKTSPTQHDSAASDHVVAGDGTSLDCGNDVETYSESLASSQSLPSTTATVGVTSEPSLTTSDALEKYQIFSEKLGSKPESPEVLPQLVEVARNPVASAVSAVSFREDSNRQAKDKKAPNYSISNMEANNDPEMVESDPAVFRDRVSGLFAEWYGICEPPGVNDGACSHYVLKLQQSGLLKGDDTSYRFFRCLTEIAVSHCLSSEIVNSRPKQSSQQAKPLSFVGIDLYAKLVVAILKFFPADQGSNRDSLLPKILAITVIYIQRDAEEKKSSFNPRPYFRLFIYWLLDLVSMEPNYDAKFQVLSAFANAFHSLQPLKVPGFSFGWLELVSHKSFMPKLLTGKSQKGWPYMQRLLVDLFQFLEPFLRNAELRGPVHFLYKGTLRVLLVLLHDFPEFLCNYHFNFCDVISPSCIQMRHIILSAFPRNIRLPDPCTSNLKIDSVAEITQSPRILSEVDAALKTNQMKGDVDDYLKNRQHGSSFLTNLRQKLLLPPSDAARTGTSYNIPLINSLVLYVGMQAIQQLHANSPETQSMASSVPLAMYLVGAGLEFFQTLIMDLDTEGRYLFINAIANQLRYPNNHTHYFFFVLLYLFAESTQEIIQEQITRVLLERLIVHRPHPWGLLVTFIELIRNPRYNFWSRSFTRCAPEIERLFKSVSTSHGPQNLSMKE